MFLFNKEKSLFFATVPRGLEASLAEELQLLGAGEIEITEGGVHFTGPFVLCYRVNLHSRIASRVFWKVAQGYYRSEHDFYDTAREIPWEQWFTPQHTIRVDTVARNAPLRSLQFVSLKIKDAVCDRFREGTGVRPSVNRHEPDMRIHAFLDEKNYIISLDTSGEPLFKRGWRQKTVDAPIRENLAAGIIALTGWTPDVPLLDPMCGSGTFLVEAAYKALHIAPGLHRSFAFFKMNNFDKKAWKTVLGEAEKAEKEDVSLSLFAGDVSPKAIEVTRTNLAATGLSDLVSVKQINILDTIPPHDKGMLIANLPYGERMGTTDALRQFYPKMGDIFKQRFSGWSIFLFSADRALPKKIGLATSRRIPLFNGALECRLYRYDIY